jgi:glycosyltransferase involved in cell wall biosynthesis
MKVSVIIPSYKDPLLHKTINSLLENSELGDQFEVIPVIDGYKLKQPIIKDARVRPLFLKKNTGMRGAINAGVAFSKAEFIMRTDEHCTFGKGFDRILTETFEDNWIVTPRRYFLDPDKWEVMDIPPNDYNKLKIRNPGPKFFGVDWPSRTAQRKDIMIDETMAMQGSCWIMKRSWWDKVIGELQVEGYGTHNQDSVEMVFKTWKAGGKLMVNKNTWHAHKHREFPRTHNYGGELVRASCRYAIEIWNDYYQNEIRPKWKV